MTLAVRPSQQLNLVLSDAELLPGLLGMGHQVPIPDFRGARVRVLAEHNLAGQRLRAGEAPGPVTDPLRLELLTGSAEATGWPRPVVLGAVIEAVTDPVMAVQRASRWASYAARVAVVPAARSTTRRCWKRSYAVCGWSRRTRPGAARWRWRARTGRCSARPADWRTGCWTSWLGRRCCAWIPRREG